MGDEGKAAYRVRPATSAATRAIADVLLQQVTHDGFHDFFFPGQDEYPEDFRDWWWRYTRRHVLRPWLMTLVGEDAATGVIVGMAMWAFQPRPEWAPSRLGSTSRRIRCRTRQYLRIADALRERYYPNCAVDGEAMAELGPVMTELEKKLWKGEDRVSWYCFEIAVDRTWPGAQELWDALMQWGPERAQVDQVAAFAGAGTPDELRGMECLGYA
ncbi:hypothetical protein AURDEDRAFT_168017 [Auricularia subglabra TFB-10046 SS5]|nr:hypothetical protein AURDEDRAFT_168017 [Auricularia subglabra TFB-10046 SS5]